MEAIQQVAELIDRVALRIEEAISSDKVDAGETATTREAVYLSRPH